MAKILQRTFRMHFLEMYFDALFSYGPYWQYVTIAVGNGLVSNREQAIA